MQKIMSCSTPDSGLRSACDSWGFEDGDAVDKAYTERLGGPHHYRHPNLVPVGLIGGGLGRFPCYPTVLHAIGDGWKLLSPPSRCTTVIDGKEIVSFEWWLVRD